MSNGNGHRWSKFWWQDWQRDEGLRSCSFAAQGLWMRMLCIAHEADPCGYVLINGKAPTMRKLASMGNTTEKEVFKLLAELEAEGVFSRTDDGTIFSRRMVRDAAASEAGREHIGKRWNGERPTSPPIRGGIREPTRRPNGTASSPPITPEAEVQTEPEPEAEERKEVLKKPFFSGTAARAERRPDALEAVLSEVGVTAPEPEPVGAEVVQMEIQRTKKALEMRIPYGEVRSVEAQLDALKEQPAAVGSDASMGLRWRPAEPIRTPAEQYAAIMGCPLAEAEARLPISPRATADA